MNISWGYRGIPDWALITMTDLTLFVNVVVAFSLASTNQATQIPTVDGCPSPQYLELGVPGTVRCSFIETFVKIYWYDSTKADIADKEPVLLYRRPTKSGPGYTSGEFDIDPNGSLIITNVSLEHEMTFTAEKITSRSDPPEYYSVRVIVTVTPTPALPVVDGCDSSEQVCLLRQNDTSELTCEVRLSRPAIPLAWKPWPTANDDPTEFISDIRNASLMFTSSVSLAVPPVGQPSVDVFSCMANDPLNLLRKSELVVITYSTNSSLSSGNPIEILVERKTQVRLLCGTNENLVVIWERQPETVVGYSINGGVNYTHSHETGTDLDGSGSLKIAQVGIHHEGLYLCLYSDGACDRVTTYELSVFVMPNPAYAVVPGCGPERYCVLKAGREGNLICSVRGVRPAVNLEWSFPDNEATSDVITFFNRQIQSHENRETIDVTLTVNYEIHDTTVQRLTLECRVSGPTPAFSRMSTPLDLLVTDDDVSTTQTATATATTQLSVVIPVVALVALLIVLIVAIILIRKVFFKPTRAKNAEDPEQEIPMIPRITDEMTRFIHELKRTYENWYSAVLPIPFMQDKPYPVNLLFVEEGIEYLTTDDRWESLGTYHNIPSDPRVKSNRRILEGEPGYGKTTLTLQLAYEWCRGLGESVEELPEVLIIIRLRQFKGIGSLAEAIKLFLLPKDTEFGVDDIDRLLKEAPSKMLILDGFDEFPGDGDQSTLIQDIVSRKILQDTTVLLTTRSSFLPRNMTAVTKRIRLTGFNDECQDLYLKKILPADEASWAKIKEILKDNPVLADLCQAPLFFAMFAHLSQQDDTDIDSISSATGFFRYVISCLHHHLKRKMDDENVVELQMWEKDHRKLDKIAYEHLDDPNRLHGWEKVELCNLLGESIVGKYLRIGIFLEEDSVMVNDAGTIGHIKTVPVIRFNHKLYCEWYAAHHLVEVIRTAEDDLDEMLDRFDPNNYQYLFRFVCGIDVTAAADVISYLQSVDGYEPYAILCMLEQKNSAGVFIDHLKRLCSTRIQISHRNTRILDRSISQILEIASIKQLQVNSLTLDSSFVELDENNCIVLQSGIRLPCLTNLKELWVDTVRAEYSVSQIESIFRGMLESKCLERITFASCILPESLGGKDVLAQLQKRNITVMWHPSSSSFTLVPQTGTWQYKDGGSDLKHADYVRKVETYRTMNPPAPRVRPTSRTHAASAT